MKSKSVYIILCMALVVFAAGALNSCAASSGSSGGGNPTFTLKAKPR